MDASGVSIIIPNYNGEQILKRSLACVIEAASAYPGSCEIIVVDDASTDNSFRMIADQFPEIKVIRHEINQGFSEAVHSGVRASMHAILIFVNTDVLPDRDFISPLVRWFDRQDTFSVSPLILDRQRKPFRVSWNLFKMVRGEIRRQNWNLSDALEKARRERPLESLFASGGSIALRKAMFEQLGGFLPIYKPFYYEDRDLCTRAWQRGWKTFFDPESRVVHDHVGTIRRFYAAKQIKIIQRRNRLFYLWLHLSKRKIVVSHIPWIFVRLILRLVKIDLVYPIAVFKALCGLGEVIKLRKINQHKPISKPLEEILKEIQY
ncbi:MAG: glycosyltransferase [Desulfobacterales bacterium]|jgi:GT2 family glycosyltransferase